MRVATHLRIVRAWPQRRMRQLMVERICLAEAKLAVAESNSAERRDPRGYWLRIDRRRGWLVIEYYGGEGN